MHKVIYTETIQSVYFQKSGNNGLQCGLFSVIMVSLNKLKRWKRTPSTCDELFCRNACVIIRWQHVEIENVGKVKRYDQSEGLTLVRYMERLSDER